ncbi:MAG: hypothetical protein WCS70_11960 [Verrucomicrobiota bacterium]
MNRNIRLHCAPLALIFLVLLCVGCATPPATMRLYDGPPQSRAATAVLKIQWNHALIQSIDGTNIQKAHSSGLILKEVEVLPGTHTVAVRYWSGNGSVRSTHSIPLTFPAKAGGNYELFAAPIDEGFGTSFGMAFGGTGRWTAWIIDAQTQKVLAGEPRTAALRWYEPK